MSKAICQPFARAMASRTVVTKPAPMQGIFVTTRPAFLGRTLIDVPYVAALTVDFGMLQSEREPRFFPMKYLQRLLGHALVAGLRMAIQTLVVGVLASMRILMLMAA